MCSNRAWAIAIAAGCCDGLCNHIPLGTRHTWLRHSDGMSSTHSHTWLRHSIGICTTRASPSVTKSSLIAGGPIPIRTCSSQQYPLQPQCCRLRLLEPGAPGRVLKPGTCFIKTPQQCATASPIHTGMDQWSAAARSSGEVGTSRPASPDNACAGGAKQRTTVNAAWRVRCWAWHGRLALSVRLEQAVNCTAAETCT